MPESLPASAASNPRAAGDEDVFYPSSDGKPMAENTWQAQAIMHAASDLAVALPEPFVAADILVYPEQGNPKNSIAPDVLVAFGVERRHRMSYFVWREGKPPDWVLEVASHSTVSADLDEKGRKYAAMGVQEYWLFDPRGSLFRRYGKPQLQGLELVDGDYQPLEPRLRDGERVIRSEALGLDVRVDGELLRFRAAPTGEDVLHRDEIELDRARQAARADEEAALRQMAEARANREADRAEREADRAEREAAARAAAEVRVAELEAALAAGRFPRR